MGEGKTKTKAKIISSLKEIDMKIFFIELNAYNVCFTVLSDLFYLFYSNIYI